jgi:hypothetical protein
MLLSRAFATAANDKRSLGVAVASIGPSDYAAPEEARSRLRPAPSLLLREKGAVRSERWFSSMAAATCEGNACVVTRDCGRAVLATPHRFGGRQALCWLPFALSKGKPPIVVTASGSPVRPALLPCELADDRNSERSSGASSCLLGGQVREPCMLCIGELRVRGRQQH